MSVHTDKASEGLLACVVVPAKDEEDLIARCLEALVDQVGLPTSGYEVILVLDDCSDDTEARAGEVLKRSGYESARFLYGAGEGVGAARKIGMDAACRTLLSSGNPSGLIASTDADSVVAPDWLSSQLALVADGAEAIGGRVGLNSEGAALPEHVLRGHREAARMRYERLLTAYRGREEAASQEHWQFSGASMSVVAEVYEKVGGLGAMRDLEDEYLERVLEAHGVSMVRSTRVRVSTSARTEGRAGRGLAYDLRKLQEKLEPFEMENETPQAAS